MSTFTIYCDLDGVLADLGRARMEGNAPYEDIYDHVQWERHGKELWKFLAPYNPIILSQYPPKKTRVSLPTQKEQWCRKHLGPYFQVISTPDAIGKGPYSGPGKILIDDFKYRTIVWEQAGGTFIHHRTAKMTIEELRRILS